MKKVKIMLAAVTVFAVVGGALAFKAKIPQTLYCTDGPNQACLVSEDIQSTIDENGSTKPFFCSTTSYATDCPAASLKFEF